MVYLGFIICVHNVVTKMVAAVPAILLLSPVSLSLRCTYLVSVYNYCLPCKYFETIPYMSVDKLCKCPTLGVIFNSSFGTGTLFTEVRS